MFARGRLPKVLRATLEYIQDAEVSSFKRIPKNTRAFLLLRGPSTCYSTFFYRRGRETTNSLNLPLCLPFPIASLVFRHQQSRTNHLCLCSAPQPADELQASAPQPQLQAPAPQSQSPTWTALDGYGSEDTPATAVSSRRSPVGGHSRHAFDANFTSGLQPPSEGEEPLQQIDTASASGKETEPLHYYRHHAKGRAHETATDRPEHHRDWDLWELQRNGDVEGRNEDELFSDGSRRGNHNRFAGLCGTWLGIRSFIRVVPGYGLY